MFTKHLGVVHLMWAAGLVLGIAWAEHRLVAAPLESVQGQIVSIDRYGLLLADQRDGTRRAFSVNQSTKIMLNGNLARLTDLRPGDTAHITVRPLGDKLIALTVTAVGQ